MRILASSAAAVLLLAGLCWLLLPPEAARLTLEPALGDPVRGAFHVHTRRSDGSGTIAEVAAAAARVGLDFVVITDHGDGTASGEPPTYVGGVLVIDAVEIGGDGGHVVALGMPTAPYPFGGETRDVVEDVQRMGGLAIAAHPTSSREQLRWTAWEAPIDGLEWINGDSQWRDEPLPALAGALLTYPVRRAATLTALLDRPEETLRRWDELTRRRPVVGLAAGDAHARVLAVLKVPAYEQVFRMMSIALPDVVFGGNAREDSRAVVSAIRDGRVYSTVDGLAGPGVLVFEATQAEASAVAGGRLPAGEPVTVRVASNAPPGARVVLLADGAVVDESDGARLEFVDPAGESRAYRAEVHLSGAGGGSRVPWVVSNPIYIGFEEEPSAPSTAADTDEEAEEEPLAILYGDEQMAAWHVEQSSRSQSALDEVPAPGGTQLLLRWGLGGTISEGPFVALVTAAGSPGVDTARLRFTGRAERPMRLSVQVRTSDGLRWHRSVYLDAETRVVDVALADMRPREPGVTGPPVARDVRDLLFVVDTVNAALGSNGQVWVDEVRLVP